MEYERGTRSFEQDERRRAFKKTLQDDFMTKIMERDPTLIAQMIKNRIRKVDWDYLVRKSLYNSYEDMPYKLEKSFLYDSIISFISNAKFLKSLTIIMMTPYIIH